MIALELNVNGLLSTGGAGAGFGGVIDPGTGQPLFALANDVNWTLNLTASLPIFSGGSRVAERGQSAQQLEQLRTEREAVSLAVEQEVRRALHGAGASNANIRNSSDAAAAADRNLELITDSYARGVVSIIDLLDAQNQALVAHESAANAVYRFLLDVMRTSRAIGSFYFLLSDDEQDRFFARLEAYFASAGLPIGQE